MDVSETNRPYTSQRLHKPFLKWVCAFLVLNVLLIGRSVGQLSPGDLAQPHAHLEGLSNCTQCHSLGDKVSSQKCMDCHKEIKALVDARRGYHSSREVRNKECFSCHSDHHGRRFDMLHFDEDNFNHDLTGFELTGAHKETDCRECHKPDLIADREIRKRKDTWLGMGTDCLDCHDDYHQKTLGTDCASCHTTEAFAPATKFDHDDTDFALKGKHIDVDCAECHKKEIRNGEDFQHFANVAFTNCNSCHDDAHQGNLGNNCKQCHTEAGWDVLTGLKHFNHNSTGFPLKGKHQRVDCFKCHKTYVAATTVFQDQLGIGTSECAKCHEDVHEGHFGSNCAECHNEKSFKFSGDPDKFDHSLTDFPLEGKHISVDCAKCHTSGHYTDPLPFANCTDCHEDYHEGAFTEGIKIRDCSECHTVDGFSPSTFEFEQHAATDFPLEGAHMATPCIACHLSDTEEWSFVNLGTNCIDCHEDVHEGELDTRWYPDKQCQNCHITDSWTSGLVFDHAQTDFALEGAHARTNCSECHLKEEPTPHGRFRNMEVTCSACHDNVHGSQFEQQGITDCARCHGFEAWDSSQFDHSKTKFPLEGKHADVDCAECHKEKLIDGELRVEYKIRKFECIDCHGD